MTIKSIKLKNFQAHRDLQVDFVPGVNAIVGPTNVGKSSVFRAVRWLVEHKPISGLQTFDTEDTRVGIKSDAGSVIRFKSSKGYGYRIGSQDFVACGTNQPSEVQQSLGLAEINLQGQHDAPFLLTLTPGQMAKELNRIVDLSVIDKAMAATASAVAAAKSQANAVEELAKGYEAKAAKLAWVPQADEDLAAIEAIEAEIQSAKTRVVQTEQALLGLLSNHNQQQQLEPLIQELAELAKLIAAFEGDVAASRRLGFAVGASETNLACLRDVNAAGKALAGLAVDAKAITESTTKILAIRSLVASYAKLGALGDFGPELDSMLADAASIKSANDTIVKIKSILGSHRLAIDAIASQDKELARLEKEKPICPTCGKPL
jgi:DNA repair ATPase RecN